MKVDHKKFLGGVKVKTKVDVHLLPIVDFVGKSVQQKPLLLDEKYKQVLINLMVDSSYGLSHDIILKDQGFENFVKGLKAISITYKESDIRIILGEQEREIIKNITESIDGLANVSLVLVKDKEPIGYLPLMYQVAFGKMYKADNKDLFQLDAQKVIAYGNQKDTEQRLILLVGNGFNQECIIKVAVGTPIGEILEKFLKPRLVKDYRADDSVLDSFVIVKNSPIYGEALSRDSYIDGDTRSLICKEIKESEIVQSEACISCGKCSAVCPAGIEPHLLMKYSDKGIYNDRPLELGLDACINCNLCDYVCPSKLSISKSIQDLKTKIDELNKEV